MILAIDPGKLTGIAVFQDRGPQAFQLGFQEACDFLGENIAPGGGIELVIVERFIIGPSTGKLGDVNWSLEVIGVTRWLATKAGVPLRFQAPADAKRFATDARLKALGWYTPTPGGHANDALRHLVVGLVADGWWDPRLVL